MDTFYAENLARLKNLDDELEVTKDGIYLITYVGSSTSLDPCGQHHRADDIYRGDAPTRCVQFWKSMERAAETLGGWIEEGEYNPRELYFYRMRAEVR